MSYSFSVVASSKAEAFSKATEEFDKVVAAQPVHAADQVRALACVETYLNLLVNPAESEEVRLSVSGSVGWRAEGEFINAGVSLSAYLAAKT